MLRNLLLTQSELQIGSASALRMHHWPFEMNFIASLWRRSLEPSGSNLQLLHAQIRTDMFPVTIFVHKIAQANVSEVFNQNHLFLVFCIFNVNQPSE
jgi:hypothetical protein